MWAVRLQSVQPVWPTSRTYPGSGRPVGPTIGTCKRFIRLVGPTRTIVPCKHPVTHMEKNWICLWLLVTSTDAVNKHERLPSPCRDMPRRTSGHWWGRWGTTGAGSDAVLSAAHSSSSRCSVALSPETATQQNASARSNVVLCVTVSHDAHHQYCSTPSRDWSSCSMITSIGI